ncbi:MAG: 23S rRNA (pseudouridine(1915)-N(3))-methyltransferase RlmH [Sphingobacteriales bacterium]|nr:23S rRNA (pseudouridine(1915)-N(3))-methyltransferase RlmH [Sphingobacteriales bacterium]MCC7224078.1 23S rRNA (pseudouridine(1915)-N(3))-methyltransferase RlmH [Chitinophagales bacterium]
MKITFLSVGKTDMGYLNEGIDTYRKRIQKYATFELSQVPDLKNTRHLPTQEVITREGQAILQAIAPADYLVLLDDRGKSYTSPDFAQYLLQLQLRNTKHLVFLCGGAYGFSTAVYERANAQLSLSAMTFSHQLVRLVFMEQLYRAFSILNNEPYHH